MRGIMRIIYIQLGLFLMVTGGINCKECQECAGDAGVIDVSLVDIQGDTSQSDAVADAGDDPTEDGRCERDGQCRVWDEGAKCINGFCGCAADSDCPNPTGWTGHCDMARGICQCEQDTDCFPEKPACLILEEYGITNICVECTETSHCTGGKVCDKENLTCVDPCADDTPCQENEFLPHCGPTGECVECTADAHCYGERPFCATTGDKANTCVGCTADQNCKDMFKYLQVCLDGTCAQCNTSTDCAAANNPNGPTCSQSHRCTCGTDADCNGDHTWGSRCDTATKSCGCYTSDNCVKRADNIPEQKKMGLMCDLRTKSCGCTVDTECVTTSMCERDYNAICVQCLKDVDCTAIPGAQPICKNFEWSLKDGFTCIVACTKAEDCQYNGIYRICDLREDKLTKGHCVECQTDTDCENSIEGFTKCFNDYEIISQTKKVAGKCVECLSDTDCQAVDPNGVCNMVSHRCVSCTEDTQCANDQDGHRCIEGACGCLDEYDCENPETENCLYGICMEI